MRKADKFNPFRAEERLRRVKRATFAGIIFGNRSLILITRQVAAACHFLVPWDACHYPGLGRGLRQLVQNRVGTETALKWRKRNPAPLWAMRLLLDRVRSNIQLGLRVEDALARAIAEKEALPYKPRGLEIIDDATGLPKYRNRVGKRKVDREV